MTFSDSEVPLGVECAWPTCLVTPPVPMRRPAAPSWLVWLRRFGLALRRISRNWSLARKFL